MKKPLLLSLGLAALASLGAQAGNVLYTFGEEVLGEITGVSDNGRFAVIHDDEDILSYVWDSQNPEQLSAPMDKYILMDVSDDGLCVGALQEGDAQYPGYLLNGEWQRLPVDANTLLMSRATAVNPDASIIGGYLQTKAADVATGARYFPCIWTRDEDGDYVLTVYNDLDLGDHQGMFVSAMSNDGRCLAGTMSYGFAAQLMACVVDGELKLFNNLEQREEEWYWQGKPQGLETVYYIDGFKDYSSTDTFEGYLMSCDTKGNFYGTTTRVTDLNEEDGTGRLYQSAVIYNYLTDETNYSDVYTSYTCGLDAKVEFLSGDDFVEDGAKKSLTETFGFTTEHQLAGVSKVSMDGKVIGGLCAWLHPATFEYMYEPFILLLEEPLVDASGIEVSKVAEGLHIVVSRGRIDFAGALGEVYDLSGRKVGEGATVNLPAGTYVARLGAESKTVVVR